MNNLKTIIAGSRSATKKDVFDAIGQTSWACQIDTVISGTAKGADKFGEAWAKDHNRSITYFPANWNVYGRAAVPIRNKAMAEYAHALIAVLDGKSKGTKNMIELAKKQGLLVEVFYISKMNVSSVIDNE